MNLIDIIKKKKAKQVTSLYTSMILSMVIGINISIFNTRVLSPQAFGDYKFILNLYAFAVTFVTFGFLGSAGRLHAKDENKNIIHQLTGNSILISIVSSILFSLCFFIFSYFENDLFNNNLGPIIRLFTPLLLVFPFQVFLENILRGANRIYSLSVLRIGPSVAYLMVAYVVNYFCGMELITALLIQFLTLFLVIVILTLLLKPSFSKLSESFKMIVEENKRFGFQVYLGALAGVATGKLGGIFIGYFVDNINVGFYSLALTITAPLQSIPNVVGTAFFKEFANVEKLPIKVTLVTIATSLLALLGFSLLIEPVVIAFYTKEYLSVVPLAQMIAFGSLLHGFGDFLNKFLYAKGDGIAIRNGAIVTGVVNAVGYALLVYFWGSNGAAYTKIMAGGSYFGMMFYYYYKRKSSFLKVS